MNISIVGSGRVATHLAKTFYAKGHHLVQIIGRNKEASQALATRVEAQSCSLYNEPLIQTDLIILAIADDALFELDSSYFPQDTTLVHTSGSVAMDVLSAFPKHGVFYPLQTFSLDREVDFSSIPVFIESNDPNLGEELFALGMSISSNVAFAGSKERKQLHLAAVFACNFSNQMFALAKDLLDQEKVSFEWLKPLILETAAKAVAFDPNEVQTGPAVRNDQRIISSHMDMLEGSPKLQELYQLMTQMIYNKQS